MKVTKFKNKKAYYEANCQGPPWHHGIGTSAQKIKLHPILLHSSFSSFEHHVSIFIKYELAHPWPLVLNKGITSNCNCLLQFIFIVIKYKPTSVYNGMILGETRAQIG